MLSTMQQLQQHCRVRVHASTSPSAVCWLAFTPSSCPLIANVQQTIQAKLSISTPVSLFLDGALLPENELSSILRDGDLICVKSHDKEDRVLRKVRTALDKDKSVKRSYLTKKRRRADDGDEDEEDKSPRKKNKRVKVRQTADAKNRLEAENAKKQLDEHKKTNQKYKDEVRKEQTEPKRKKKDAIDVRLIAKNTEKEFNISAPISNNSSKSIRLDGSVAKQHPTHRLEEEKEAKSLIADSDGSAAAKATGSKKKRRRGRRGRRRPADEQETNSKKETESELKLSAKREPQQNYTVPVKLANLQAMSVNYTQWPTLTSMPPVGTHVAFKIMEMAADYTPEISNFKEGTVIACNPLSRHLTIKLAPHSVEVNKHQGGRFELEDMDDSIDQSDQVETEWDLLLDVRVAPA